MPMFSRVKGEKEVGSGGKKSLFRRLWSSMKKKLSPKVRKERKVLKKLMEEKEQKGEGKEGGSSFGLHYRGHSICLG